MTWHLFYSDSGKCFENIVKYLNKRSDKKIILNSHDPLGTFFG